MATAREALYDEVVALIAQGSSGLEEAMTKIMARYRVQTKPGVQIPAGTTARDALGDRLIAIIRAHPADMNDRIGSTIDEFRMQAKGKGGGAPSSKPPKSAPKAAPPRPSREPPVVAERESDPLPTFMPASEPLRSGRRGAEPVAGGPRRRGRSRSECPKCHSMGVVLARSYAGDEYFSCIYCGWQAYKPPDENDPTASLAGRLLGQGGGTEN